MRAINADELVFDYSGLVYINPHDFQGIAKYFAKQIERMPTIEPEPHWIPFEKEKPKDGQKILVSTKFEKVFQSSYSETEEDDPYCIREDTVIAWMPLPAPYKAESENKK